ncbi:MAG: hypothetical protein H8E38_03930 [SAR324 cluster bacterium]|nr:hypothetical protein [SAR324 cluster bacterium]MBL7035900.1 hypothetical protein [SAR324 cluster bacterium]
MDENINSIAEFRLIPGLINNISEEGREWLARAILNVLIVDKHLSHEEKSYLKDAISIVESEVVRGELLESINKRETLEMEELISDRKYAGEFFFFLGMVVAADGKIKTSEVKMLTTICGKLGFPPETAKAVLRWVADMIKLNNDRNQITEIMREIKPVFV